LPPTPLERIRQTGRLLRTEGASGVTARLVARAAKRVAPAGYGQVPIRRTDLIRAGEIAAAGGVLPAPLEARPGEPLTVAWVCYPPSGGSGGHTTMFRVISALERAGHRCIVYMDDGHGWSVDQHERTVRTHWPDVRAEIRDLDAGIEDAHAIFATAWQTAYPVLTSPSRGTRFYLVQDHEPDFYPAGSLALLAEATYGFGFHGVTVGRWLAERMRRDYGMAADHFPFACDLERYRFDPASERAGVCYYCRPSTPRRAYELAVAALDLFAERHPEVEIHLFGAPGRSLPFRATDHGLLTPDGLNELYNRCIAGLTLSATNVSLVPHEMLGSGCIPVVNDAEHNRMVLDNPHVAYAPASPYALAEALAAIVEQPAARRRANAHAAAASVMGSSWEDTGAIAESIVRRVVEEANLGRAAA
jgi:glycosyltransferase involved in cell wall biosynthesis